MKRAFYRGIPAYFNEETGELRGRNILYGFLIDFYLWIDTCIFPVDELVIEVLEDEE